MSRWIPLESNPEVRPLVLGGVSESLIRSFAIAQVLNAVCPQPLLTACLSRGELTAHVLSGQRKLVWSRNKKASKMSMGSTT
jgi:hypothetical protein